MCMHTPIRIHARARTAARLWSQIPNQIRPYDGRPVDPRTFKGARVFQSTCRGSLVDDLPSSPTDHRRPHLRRDWARRCHICAGTGLAAAASALGLAGGNTTACNVTVERLWRPLRLSDTAWHRGPHEEVVSQKKNERFDECVFSVLCGLLVFLSTSRAYAVARTTARVPAGTRTPQSVLACSERPSVRPHERADERCHVARPL